MSSAKSIDELKDLLLGLQIETKNKVKKILKDNGKQVTKKNEYSFLKNFPSEKKKKANILKFYSMDVDNSSKEDLSDAISSMEELQETLSKEHLIKLPDTKSSSSGRETNFKAMRKSAIPPSPVLGKRRSESQSNLKSLSNLRGNSSDEGEGDMQEFTFKGKRPKTVYEKQLLDTKRENPRPFTDTKRENPRPFTHPLTLRTGEDIGEMMRLEKDYNDSRWETDAYYDGSNPKGTIIKEQQQGGRRKKKKRKTRKKRKTHKKRKSRKKKRKSRRKRKSRKRRKSRRRRK